MLLEDGPLETLDDARECCAEGVGDAAEFDDVYTSLTALVAADERLRSIEAGSELNLGQAGLGPQVTEEIGEDLVFLGVQRLLHRGSKCGAYRISKVPIF